jgi:acetyl/propionyl-CoA carboxylase alpha subunit
MASLMADESTVTRIGAGVYRVVGHDGRSEIVYVAGPSDDRWAFWNGQVFHGDFSGRASREPRGARAHSTQSLTAPMPATVLKVQVKPGDTVKKGDIVVVLEAMKMELPIRAPGDGVVATVSCREGELVQADAMLVELE